jgi:hydroxyacylglutathione hydrolase
MKILPLLAFKDNYIWMFYNEDTKHAWLVDPGEAAPASRALAEHRLTLEGIFITHHHYDHSGGIATLVDHWPEVKVYGGMKSPLIFVSHHVKEGDEIPCGDWTFKAMEIPGHTLDHTAFYTQDIVFSGDTLFSFGAGKIFEGTPEQMYHSLSKLANLPEDTKIYCGHEYTLANLKFAKHLEPDNTKIAEKINEITSLREKNIPSLPSFLRDEKLLNPFLRCKEESIIKAVENYAQKKLNNPVDVFAKLREWKNHFIIDS